MKLCDEHYLYKRRYKTPYKALSFKRKDLDIYLARESEKDKSGNPGFSLK
jgi:hypothetical protein